MPALPASNLARGFVKSLKKRLNLKNFKKHIVDPFNKKIHCKNPSSVVKSKSKPKSKSKKKSTSKTKSVAVQVSLPCRSLLQQLSHEGSIDVMSHMYGPNTNQNNSVDYGSSHYSAATNVTPTPKRRGTDSSKTRHTTTTTGGHSSGRLSTGASTSGAVGGSILPNKYSVTSTKSSSSRSKHSSSSSHKPTSSSAGATGVSKSTQRSIGTSTIYDQYSYCPRTTSTARAPSPSSSSHQSRALGYPSGGAGRRSHSPSPSRRHSQSLSRSEARTVMVKDQTNQTYSPTDVTARRPLSPSVGRRSRSHSLSDSLSNSGRSNSLLQRRDSTLPSYLRQSPSPPAYHRSPIVTERSKSLERLMNQNDDNLLKSSKYSRSRVPRSDSVSLSPAAGRTYISSSSTQYTQPSHSLSNHRRSSLDSTSLSQHRHRSPSPLSTRRGTLDSTSSAQSSESTALSEARQRRKSLKKQESSTTSRSSGGVTTRECGTSTTGASVERRGTQVAKTESELDMESLYRVKLAELRSQSELRKSVSDLKISISTSSVANSLPSDSKGSFDGIVGVCQSTTVGQSSSAGQSSTDQSLSITPTSSMEQGHIIFPTPPGTRRRRSPRHRIKMILRKIYPRKRCGPCASAQVLVPHDDVERMFCVGGLVGLENVGNTCYMNCILQCLSHTLEMTQIFLHPEFENCGVFSKAYTRLMNEIWHKVTPLSIETSRDYYSSIFPFNFKRVMSAQFPMYHGIGQHDTQEFLRNFLGGLHDEMKMEVSKKYCPFTHTANENSSNKEHADHFWHTYRLLEDSLISEIFMGLMKSTLTCSVCKNSSVTFDPSWDVILPVPVDEDGMRLDGSSKTLTVRDCFKEYCRKEVLDGDNKPVCGKCRKSQRSYKQMSIQRLPPILVVVLKRFTGFTSRKKLEVDIEIPQILDPTRFVSSDFSGKVPKYELYGTCNHSGTACFGHYVSWVKHYATDEWYEFNDASVEKLNPPHKVTQSKFTSKAPYVLFYRQTYVEH